MADTDIPATLAEAMARPDAYANPGGAVTRWAAGQEIEARREHFTANPLDGMACCAMAGVAAPDWLARAFLAGYYRVTGCKAKSWDEAFGAPYPKGVQLAALRRRRNNRVKAAVAISDGVQRDPERPIDPAFWEHIGASIGEGKTRAEELYREAVLQGLVTQIQDIRKSAGASTRPAKLRKLAGISRRR